MKTLLLEVRDRMTIISVVATQMRPDSAVEQRLLRCAGYSPWPSFLVLLARAQGGESNYDPYSWRDRTMTTAHHWITLNFDSLKSGHVVDVEVILGEKATTNP